MMIQLEAIFLLFSCFTSQLATAQNGTDSDPDIIKPLHPSIFWVIGVISAVLSMAFMILAYAKFCRRYPLDIADLDGNHLYGSGRAGGPRLRSSGIDQAVIDSLPFFTFSSLKGSKHGLECAVCLSKFEETEFLRLLPKCKHAFHRTCIGKWLLVRSSCPLCRSEIDPKDVESFNTSTSLRYSRAVSNLTDEPDLEIFIERGQQNRLGSSRFSFNIGSISFSDKRRRQQDLVVEVRNSSGGGISDMLKHKIIVSEVVIKNRWSDVNSSDLLSLSTEMLSDMSRRKMSAPVDMESTTVDQKSRMINHNREEKRSMSEITQFLRSESDNLRGVQGITEQGCSKKYTTEERTRRLWLPIAQRTVHWLASRENKLQELEFRRHISEV